MPPCGSFDLEEATIDDMQAAMEAGILTSTQLVVCYMIRTYQTQEYIKYVSSLSEKQRDRERDRED